MSAISFEAQQFKVEVPKIYEMMLSNPTAVKASTIFKQMFSHLRECDCILMPRRIRHAIEDELISQIKQKYEDKTVPLRIASFGSGECFEEARILTMLLDAGYENVEITVVDTVYANSNKSAEELRTYINDVLLTVKPQAKIELKVQISTDEYIKSITTPPSVLLLIDLQGDSARSGNGDTVLKHCFNKLERVRALQGSLIAYSDYKDNNSNNITICNVINPFQILRIFKLKDPLFFDHVCPTELKDWNKDYAICVFNSSLEYKIV